LTTDNFKTQATKTSVNLIADIAPGDVPGIADKDFQLWGKSDLK
jgi:hypothetical protein